MAIPLRNLYYLLCYAWNHLEARAAVPVSAELGDRVENLLAHVLSEGVARLARQGLDHGYQNHDVELAGVRGKLRVSDTVARCLVPSGKTACQVDELSADVAHNRVLKAAMRTLAALDTVEGSLRTRLSHQLGLLRAVADIELCATALRPVTLHRNIARYALLLEVCRLLVRCLLADPRTGDRRFVPFTASDQAMGSLFEDFLFHFLRREQDVLRVGRRHLDWNATAEAPGDLAWLPKMRTDVLLSSPTRTLVLEAKFYREPVSRQRSGQPKLRSGHLYQLVGYLDRLREPGRPPPEGVLVYAAAGQSFDLRYRLAGHGVRVVTLDLDRPWPDIHQAIQRLVQ